MTFTLEGYKNLKEVFKDTITMMKNGEKKEDIDEYHNARRILEIHFLEAVFKELDERMKPSGGRKIKTLTPWEYTVYGAMLLVLKDITNNHGVAAKAANYLRAISSKEKKDGSTLHRRLILAMNVTESNQPSVKQQAACFQTLNQFLNLIYTGSDPRNGIAPTHALDVVPCNDLSQLVHLSYDQEKQLSTAYIKSLSVTGKSTSYPEHYDFKEEVPPKLAASSPSWDALYQSFHDLVLKETGRKKVAEIRELAEPRATQFGYLQAIADSLNKCKAKSKSAEKVAIFKGAMHIVRIPIGEQYGILPFSPEKTSKSVTHAGLTKLLGLAEGEIDIVDIEHCLKATYDYVTALTIEKAGCTREITEDAIRMDNPFSKIKNFDLKANLAFNLEVIKACRSSTLDMGIAKIREEVEKKRPAEEEKESYMSYVSKYLTFPSNKASKAEKATASKDATAPSAEPQPAPAPAM